MKETQLKLTLKVTFWKAARHHEKAAEKRTRLYICVSNDICARITVVLQIICWKWNF